MTSDEYIQNAIRTESHNFQLQNPRILHGAMGCCTEAGELLDAVKKHIFYGREIDVINVKEEIGDLFWYLGILCHTYGWTFDEIWDINIAKLKQRYPEMFTEDKANNRDLDAERKILEGMDDKPKSFDAQYIHSVLNVCPSCEGTRREGHGELCSICNGKRHV